MKSAYEILKPYAIVGWLVIEKEYSIQEINDIKPFELILLEDDFKRFYAKKCKE